MPLDSTVRSDAIATRHRLIADPALEAQRNASTVWSGVVLWDPYPDRVSDEWLMTECQRIRDCGFQAIRFHHVMPTYKGNGEWDTGTADRWLSAAEAAGFM